MQWLEHWGLPCIRLNASDLSRVPGPVIEVRNGRVDLEWQHDGRQIRASEIDVVWFRRWTRTDIFDLEPPDIIGDEGSRLFNQVSTSVHTMREMRVVSQIFFAAFARATWLNHPRSCNVNKLDVLRLAQLKGLDTPATLVTGDPERVRQFIRQYPKVITKCASDLTAFKRGDTIFTPSTMTVDEESVASCAWRGGFPSVFQERLVRAYEIRIFYIDGDCYASAYVFGDESESIADGRIANPRSTPFKLPESIRQRLGELMRALNLDLGCIDMIRTRDDRWVFLEVNPNGQFWSDGFACNYQLDKRIAQALARRLHDRRQAEYRIFDGSSRIGSPLQPAQSARHA
jgi:hypothetical protein